VRSGVPRRAPAHRVPPTPASGTRTRCTAARSALVRSAAARRGREGRIGTAARAPPPGRSGRSLAVLVRWFVPARIPSALPSSPFVGAARNKRREASASTSLSRDSPSVFKRGASEWSRSRPQVLPAFGASDCGLYVDEHTPWVTAGSHTAEVGVSTLADERLNHKRDVSGAFAEPTHEVWKPFAAEGDVHPDLVPLLDERQL